jgi:hypothetical protein
MRPDTAPHLMDRGYDVPSIDNRTVGLLLYASTYPPFLASFQRTKQFPGNSLGKKKKKGECDIYIKYKENIMTLKISILLRMKNGEIK